MKFLSIFMLLLILLASISCVTASSLNDDSYSLNDVFNDYDNLFNLLKTNSNNLHNYTSNNSNIKNLINNISTDNYPTSNNLNNSTIINSTNVYHNTSNLVDKSIDKDNKNNLLSNDNLPNYNQFNNSLKPVRLNKDTSVNDNPINNKGKELNNSKLNNNVSNGFSEDNFISYVPETKTKNYNNYIMLLIFGLLALLGTVYYIKKKKGG